MKICPSCGKKCADSSSKCIYCGSELEIKDSDISFIESQNQSETRKSPEEDYDSEISEKESQNLVENALQHKIEKQDEEQADHAKNSRVYSFSDSLPTGFSMTQEEALSLLFDDHNADTSDDDFGNAVPVLSDDEIILKSGRTLALPFGSLFGIICILSFVFSMLSSIMALFNTNGLDLQIFRGVSSEFEPFVLIVSIALLLLPHIIMFIGSCCLYFISNLLGLGRSVSGSFSSVKIGLAMGIAFVCAAAVYVDYRVIWAGLFKNFDSFMGLLFVLINFLALLKVIRYCACFVTCKNCTDVINVAQRLKAPSFAIDITLFAEIVIFIAVGFLFVFNGGMSALAESDPAFCVSVVISYFSLILEKIFFAYCVIVYRAEINSAARVAMSVEQSSSHKLKYK